MSPDRTAPTTLRPTLAPRLAAPEAPADGFAALLGAADKAAPSRGHDDVRRDDEARWTRERAGRDDAAAGRDEAVSRTGEVAGRDDAAATAGRDDAFSRAPEVAGRDDALSCVGGAGSSEGGTLAADEVGAPNGGAVLVAGLVDEGVGRVGVATSVRSAMAGELVSLLAVTSPPAVVAGGSAPGAPSAASPMAVAGSSVPVARLPVEAVPPVSSGPPTTGAPPAAVEAATSAPGVTPAVTAAPPVAVQAETNAPAVVPPPAAVNPEAAKPANGQGSGTAGEQNGAAQREQPAPAAPPTPAPSLTPLAQRAAPLHQAPRAVAQVLQVAVERGISHAKLNLRPAELGGIEIRLQTSAAGVTAQVIADSPEAARLLHHAADELRRSLERHDVTLLSLDISTADDDRPDGSAGALADPAGERARHFAAHGLTPKADEPPPPTVVETVQLPDGLHVDVLA